MPIQRVEASLHRVPVPVPVPDEVLARQEPLAEAARGFVAAGQDEHRYRPQPPANRTEPPPLRAPLEGVRGRSFRNTRLPPWGL
ncbi:MAG TPA: hypothetical protein VH257_16645 [Chloroflexota bacterium]|nr:hypothetical protein [Chloroflexota bacterium]